MCVVQWWRTCPNGGGGSGSKSGSVSGRVMMV